MLSSNSTWRFLAKRQHAHNKWTTNKRFKPRSHHSHDWVPWCNKKWTGHRNNKDEHISHTHTLARECDLITLKVKGDDQQCPHWLRTTLPCPPQWNHSNTTLTYANGGRYHSNSTSRPLHTSWVTALSMADSTPIMIASSKSFSGTWRKTSQLGLQLLPYILQQPCRLTSGPT